MAEKRYSSVYSDYYAPVSEENEAMVLELLGRTFSRWHDAMSSLAESADDFEEQAKEGLTTPKSRQMFRTVMRLNAERTRIVKSNLGFLAKLRQQLSAEGLPSPKNAS